MFAPQHLSRSASPLAVALVLGLLTSMFCVLWFMFSAMESERIANQKRIEEMVHRDVLSTLKTLENAWLYTKKPKAATPLQFKQFIDHQLITSAIIWDKAGVAEYPKSRFELTRDKIQSPLWKLAQALEFRDKNYSEAKEHYIELLASNIPPSHKAATLQALSRIESKSGNSDRAIQYQENLIDLATNFSASQSATEIIANAHFRIIELTLATTPEDTEKLRQHALELKGILVEYRNNGLSSSQRLSLAQRLNRILSIPDVPKINEHIITAEIVAGKFSSERPTESTIVMFNNMHLLRLFEANFNIVLFVSLNAIEKYLNQSIRDQSTDISFQVTLYDKSTVSTIQAGEFQTPLTGIFRGLFLNINHKQASEPSNAQIAFYILTGSLFITLLIFLYLFIGWQIQKHERKQKLRTDILATVSHELKTPLTSTRILIDNLKESQLDLPQEVRDYIEIISNENYRLSGLVDNFMIFSRMERNKHAFSFEDILINQVIQDAVAVVSSKYPQDHAVISLPSQDSNIVMQGDESLVQTALINLIDNAYKYSPGEKHVAVLCTREGDELQISVSDQGIGLSEEQQKQIFDRFYRVNYQAEGCGLGLNITHYIIAQHGGQISVNSQLGKGTTFTVRLPLQQ